jgi:hypothetical protein
MNHELNIQIIDISTQAAPIKYIPHKRKNKQLKNTITPLPNGKILVEYKGHITFTTNGKTVDPCLPLTYPFEKFHTNQIKVIQGNKASSPRFQLGLSLVTPQSSFYKFVHSPLFDRHLIDMIHEFNDSKSNYSFYTRSKQSYMNIQHHNQNTQNIEKVQVNDKWSITGVVDLKIHLSYFMDLDLPSVSVC